MPQQADPAAIEEFLSSELVDLGVEQDAISADARFDELDIDSLDVADLMTSIKRDYGVEIPRRDLVGITLGQLVQRIASEGPAAG
jgi:acyl carrier protein